ncbi:MAG: hypothetical protein C0490_01120, partial [Marivirga sp.]|nr:hypothetical protein [Marivirga sp.]
YFEFLHNKQIVYNYPFFFVFKDFRFSAFSILAGLSPTEAVFNIDDMGVVACIDAYSTLLLEI